MALLSMRVDSGKLSPSLKLSYMTNFVTGIFMPQGIAFLCTRRSGEEVDMEVYMFAEIDDSGRFIRIEEATLMLKGRESDRDLGSVR
ncbi:Uncharacterised protein [Klebsiella pneumoniae]|nr:Uncharacterised protein [Klebsiella pneumoniae]